MPFCTQCGNQVADSDVFCAQCGHRHSGATSSASSGPAAGAPRPRPASYPTQDPLANLSPRTAAILCYIPTVGWIAAVVVLACEASGYYTGQTMLVDGGISTGATRATVAKK